MNIFRKKNKGSGTQTGLFRRRMFGKKPTEEQLQIMTQKYQDGIRNSPIWGQMVEQYGKKKAEELLKECKIIVE